MVVTGLYVVALVVLGAALVATFLDGSRHELRLPWVRCQGSVTTFHYLQRRIEIIKGTDRYSWRVHIDTIKRQYSTGEASTFRAAVRESKVRARGLRDGDRHQERQGA